MAKNINDSKLVEYKDTISQLNMVIKNQNMLIQSLQTTVEQNNAMIGNLQEQIDYLTKKLFGTSSEKRELIDGQMNLFNETELEADPNDTATSNGDPDNSDTHVRKGKRTSEEIFKGIPVKEVLIPLSEEQKICPECNSILEVIGKEFVRQEFQFTPAKGKIIKYYRETAKCPVCSNQSTMAHNIQFVKAVVPEALIPHSYASSSVVAWTMYQKYANAMPLYRQEQDWKQLGAEIKRATMANWIIYCAYHYLQPLYDYLHKELLKRSFLMADETRIQVLKEKGREAETDSFMWLFRSGEDDLPPIILYQYTQTRAKYNAETFIEGFKGYLETDGYQGYNNLPDVTRCCCWSHLRRYFIDAVPKGKDYDLSVPAVQAVQYCNKLFEYERISKEKGHSYEQRKEYRLLKEKPVLDHFWDWLSKQYVKKGTRFEKAVNYAQNHKELFESYLEDGRCSFTNNLSENSIRPFTVGRKNWLFSDTPKGAAASATVYSIVEIAKANKLNVYKYLNYLLEQRPTAESSLEELAKLVPWNEEVIAHCAME